jgi:hypothetical protein
MELEEIPLAEATCIICSIETYAMQSNIQSIMTIMIRKYNITLKSEPFFLNIVQYPST